MVDGEDWTMASEQNKTLEALQTAIQMEIDGKAFYLKASRETTNEMGRKLLESLASEEDMHRKKFNEIYEAVRNKKDWPVSDFTPDGGKTLRTVFAGALEKFDSNVKAPESELEAVQTAMDMENKSFDFYNMQAKNASGDVERNFYKMVAAEEQEHHIVLLDYYEYLKDPAGWFASKERSSLDGGR